MHRHVQDFFSGADLIWRDVGMQKYSNQGQNLIARKSDNFQYQDC